MIAFSGSRLEDYIDQQEIIASHSVEKMSEKIIQLMNDSQSYAELQDRLRAFSVDTLSWPRLCFRIKQEVYKALTC